MSPTTMTHDDALGRAVAAALEAGADDVEAGILATESHFVRFASSRFTQVGAVRTDLLRVRVRIGRSLGARMTGLLTGDEVAAAARGAVDAARVAPPADVTLAFATPSAGGPEPGATDCPPVPPERTAAHAPELLGRAFAQTEGRSTCAGCFKTDRRTLAVQTAAGVRRTASSGLAQVQVIATGKASSGFTAWAGGVDEPCDFDGLVARAADGAARGADPIELPPGAYDVVLAPPAVAELLEWMSIASFGAASLIDGTSLLGGREGEPLCDERVTLVDAPPPGDFPFDSEGMPRRRVAVIDAGRCGLPVTDLATALRLHDDRGSTGHAAILADDSAPGPCVAHLTMSAGDARDDELVSRVDRGLYVTRFHYVNGLLDTRRATMTGMTRDGLFLIEGGRVGRGVRNLRFTDGILAAFGRIGGIGRELHLVPAHWSPPAVYSVPSLLLRAFAFTGTSR